MKHISGSDLIDQLPAIKMHGTGNNFVIIDSRSRLYEHCNTVPTVRAVRTFTQEVVSSQCLTLGSRNLDYNYREIASKNNCDQVIVITNSSIADCFMHIYNADGSKAEMCGNAARCVGYLLMLESNTEHATIELINKRILECFRVGNKSIKVNMGKPLFKWHEIPLSTKCDTLHLPIEVEVLKDPVAVNIGNPHIIFFVDNVDEVPLQSLGPKLENHTLFPQKVNVSVAQIEKSGEINLRTWERGTGITASCGSAACAALVASILRGYITAQQATVNLAGGKLLIEWKNDIYMTGDIGF
ncbi:diaminopimelate epimerase [Wolbachia endosymbiont of Ctenocephalides felis wCfeT]|uniref:diaminopimelate epimerase n=1 Tax=Wolbachia endosymbiont of Ctenocephalides felis wCfeT TaxID=2732593 RepID=UPI001FE5A9F6|nr:diaminopimelate epimerase [Wolbachia endosymbiont of Ctenocephalides felis wCfeT]